MCVCVCVYENLIFNSDFKERQKETDREIKSKKKRTHHEITTWKDAHFVDLKSFDLLMLSYKVLNEMVGNITL